MDRQGGRGSASVHADPLVREEGRSVSLPLPRAATGSSMRARRSRPQRRERILASQAHSFSHQVQATALSRETSDDWSPDAKTRRLRRRLGRSRRLHDVQPVAFLCAGSRRAGSRLLLWNIDALFSTTHNLCPHPALNSNAIERRAEVSPGPARCAFWLASRDKAEANRGRGAVPVARCTVDDGVVPDIEVHHVAAGRHDSRRSQR